MSDTRNALSTLERVFRDINSTKGGLVQKPVKLFKANLRYGDIAVPRQRVVLLTSVSTSTSSDVKCISVYANTFLRRFC